MTPVTANTVLSPRYQHSARSGQRQLKTLGSEKLGRKVPHTRREARVGLDATILFVSGEA